MMNFRKFQQTCKDCISAVEKTASVITSVGTICIALLVAVLLAKMAIEFFSDKVYVSAFEVPKSMAEKGYTGKGIAKRIVKSIDDFMAELENSAVNSGQLSHLLKMKPSKKFVVPGTTIDVEGAARHIMSIINIKSNAVIADIYHGNNSFNADIQVPGYSKRYVTTKKEDPEELAKEIARVLVESHNPLAVGVYYYISGKPEELAELQGYVSNGSGSNWIIKSPLKINITI